MTAPDGVSQYGLVQYKRLRAPQDHGELLIDPPLDHVAGLIASNTDLARQRNYDLQGRSLSLLAAEARATLLDDAARYTSNYQHVAPNAISGPIIMAGHQPELYHVGVWTKSFLIDRLARRLGGHAVNLLIDNDALHSPSIQVPGGSIVEPYASSILFDAPTAEVPFEERALVDSRYFTSFADRVQATLRPFITSPLLRALWPCALDAARRSQNLGRCLAEARHRVELEWGLRTLELPLSVVCDATPFRWFTCHLLAQLDRFRCVYNDSLRQYRRVNHLRSRTHPAPNLAADDQWLEAPFWIWTAAAPQRRRLFARARSAEELEISDRHQFQSCLPLGPDRSAAQAVDVLERLTRQGVKIRPRALVTTMYARLLLCDLFVHGIGGAKYDQLTDAMIELFFRFSPPAFLTATATAKLPIPHQKTERSALQRIEHALRDLRFNPQRHVTPSAENRQLISEKLRLIENGDDSMSPRTRHQRLVQLNAELAPWVADRRLELLREREQTQQGLRAERVLGSREYSFCLFPEETLRPFLLDI